MKNESYEMNTILYTTLIKAYTKQKDINKVIEIFNTMKKNHSENIIQEINDMKLSPPKKQQIQNLI